MEQGLKQRLRRLLWRPYQTVRRFTDQAIFERRFLRRSDALHSIKIATTPGESADDAELIDRVIAAYQRATSRSASGDSMWRAFFSEFHVEIDEALRNGPRARVEEMLRNPGSCNLFYGFDNLAKILGTRMEDKRAPAQTFDGLIAFAEAIGIRRYDNPEGYRRRRPIAIHPDEVLSSLDEALGVKLEIPNPFPGHHGLATERGVISYRTPQAMYQAWRIRELVKGIANPKILEIGAGLGRTAFYAHALGIRDYTIVDIPITAVAQGYFLGRTLGAVALSGEPKGDVTLRTPEEFFTSSERYDLIVNVDSLTEMDRSVANQYIDAITARANTFLSINHESNAFTVHEMLGGKASRHPYWLRRGYVEEFVRFEGSH